MEQNTRIFQIKDIKNIYKTSLTTLKKWCRNNIISTFHFHLELNVKF